MFMGGLDSSGGAIVPKFVRSATRLIAITTLFLAAGRNVLAQQFLQETTTRFPVPNPKEYTNQLTIGDIDGDGDLDILFANSGTGDKARVYINNGAGVFTDETTARNGGLSGSFRGVELGDCDRDGDLDVILAQDFNKVPILLINNGTGFFTNETATRLPNIPLSSYRAQFGDVDNDGDLDLFATSGDASGGGGCGQYRLYRNDGTCHYTDITSTNFPIGNVCSNKDCSFGDIDNDFDIDIRTASLGSNNSKLYRNNGAGVFSIVSGVPVDESCYSYDFGDIDGDGDLDLLGANGSPSGNSENLLRNDGTGAYTDISSNLMPNPGDDDNDSRFFDYDNDGDQDLIIANLGGASEKIYKNNGSGVFTLQSGVISLQSDSSLDIKVGDLTGDGALDIVTGQGESGNFENRIYINHGPVDTHAPRIIKTEDVGNPGLTGPYVVRALILDDMSSDRNFFDKGITLHYKVDGGATQDTPMLHSGGQVYRGVIPSLPNGSQVEYWVEAHDFHNNVAIGPTTLFFVADCSGVANCSSHGTCVGQDTCSCDVGWGGPDCATATPVPAGRVPYGGPTGTPLKLRKAPGGALVLGWGASCSPNDVDYEVYQGTVGTWTSHNPVVCTTGGLKTKTFVPAAGDKYFLIVPASLNREGSYGTDWTGAQRPASLSACKPQAMVPCF
jgi:hypothetical protein